MTRTDSLPPSLEAPAAALVARYAGRHSPEVIRQHLTDVYHRLAGSAKVPDFLPIFAEREVRKQLDRAAAPTAGAPARRPAPRRAAAHPGSKGAA